MLIAHWLSIPSAWSPEWLPGKSFYYELRWKGQKTGYVVQEFKQSDTRYQVNQTTRIQVFNQGTLHQISEHETLNFDKNSLHLISASYQRRFDDELIEHSIIEEGGNWLIKGSPHLAGREASLSNNSYSLNDYLATMSWIQGQPAVGETLNAVRLDLKRLLWVETEYLLLGLTQEGYELSFKEQGKDWQGTLVMTPNGSPIKYQVGTLVEQNRVSRAEALSRPKHHDYYFDNIVKLDAPMGLEPDKVSELTLNLSEEQLSQFELTDRQTINASGHLVLTRSNASLASYGSQSFVDRKEDNERESELQALAFSVTENASSKAEQLDRLLKYVYETLIYEPTVQPMSVEQILNRQRGDCTEFTLLFNALAESLGFETRSVTGLVYLGDDLQGFGGHEWSEVKIGEEWVGLDATFNLRFVSATHLRYRQTMNTIRQPNQSFGLVSVR